MRLHKGSLTVKIMHILWEYQQLPYSAFVMLGDNFEWVKDCLQKLIKAGYVGIIKDTNLKSLYLKPPGQKSWLDYCARTGVEIASKPAIVYNADKVRRMERVNEAKLLMDMAGLDNRYLTAPKAKAILEQEAARQSDNIRYSRFAGLLFTEAGGLLVYNFGRGNIHLNTNGEMSAKVEAGRLYRECGGKQSFPRFSMLVLGSSTDTALSILNYSDMLSDKEKQEKKRFANRHFNFTDFRKVFDDILFLPVMAETPDMLKILIAPGETLYDMERQYRQEGRHMVNLMECRLHLWNNYRRSIPDNMPVDFLCYHWQIPLIQAYFINQKPMLESRCRCVYIEDVKRIMGLAR